MNDSSETPKQSTSSGASRKAEDGSLLHGLDQWVDSNPWNPRLLPYLTYLLLLFVIGIAAEHQPMLIPVGSVLQLVIVGYLLYRYRKDTPELTLSMGWLAIPSGLFLAWAWIVLGDASASTEIGFFDTGFDNDNPESNPTALQQLIQNDPAVGYTAMGLRFCTMVLLVPLFEELFIRSGCLRGLHSAKQCWLGIIQVATDLPGIGERIAQSRIGKYAESQSGQFTTQLEQTKLGNVSLFAVIASTFIFMLAHHPRDWAGCIACGIVWCAMVWWTNRGDMQEGKARMGLGPVVWSHGVTNAALWALTFYDASYWRFL